MGKKRSRSRGTQNSTTIPTPKISTLALTPSSTVSSESQKLLPHATALFSLSFRDNLFEKYDFRALSKAQNLSTLLCDFQQWFCRVSGKTFAEVDKEFLRKTDIDDIYKPDTPDQEQIIHYAINQKMRLHGIIQNATFMVLRIDPTHSVHN